jgi:hypothetical protein
MPNDEKLTYMQNYYLSHREELSTKEREKYRNLDPKERARRNQVSLKWHNEHREYLNQQAKEYRVREREAISVRRKAISKKYREKYREQIRLQFEKRNRQLRIDVVNKMGNQCVYCGVSDVRVLQIDHINGGGRNEQKKYSTQGIYRRILQMSIDECKIHYQILCANCNWIKRYENHELPNRSNR